MNTASLSYSDRDIRSAGGRRKTGHSHAGRVRRTLEDSIVKAALGFGLMLNPMTLPADSLWQEDRAKAMFCDKRASGIGDILTIIVQETTTTSKDASTTTAKSSGMDASLATFLYSPAASGLLTQNGKMPAVKYNYKNDYTGGGTINNTEKILGRIAVRVVDVLPNRNLVIEGSRQTSFSGEQQTAVLRGVVRPEDVAANNTIYSYNVSDSTIRFVSKGTITDEQRKGWLNSIISKVSPF
jgi:flagellar L-ring protein FlgH